MKKILVVEDDEAIRESLIELLETEGYQVTSAANGQLALDQVRAGPKPDLIVLDLMMAVKDGFQFCVEKNADQLIQSIPVVIMSADGHVNEKRERTGAVAYLKKPADINHVLAVVKQHIS